MATAALTAQIEAQRISYTKKRHQTAVIKSLGLVGVPYLALITPFGAAVREAALYVAGRNFLPALMFEFLLLVTPITCAFWVSEWLQHRLDMQFGISVQSARSLIADIAKRTLLRTGLWWGAFCIVYGASLLFSADWWLAAGLALGLVTVGYIVIFPALVLPHFIKMSPLSDDELCARIQALCDRAGVKVHRFCQLHMSAQSKRSNLAIAGLGSSRALLITDTALQECSKEELEALVAHELGHVWHHHMEKRAITLACLNIASCWIASHTLSLFDVSLRDMGSFPAVWVALMTANLVGLFLILRIWRRNEFAADDFAFRLMQDTTPFVTGLAKLSEKNLIHVTEENQHRFAHPATEERIRRAKRFMSTSRAAATAAC